MQKKIISLAVAALASGAAFAQSNVTIYGIMDVGVSSYSADSVKNYDGKGNNLKSARNTGVYSDGYTSSRLGFKGEEALGNGLKAVFQLESAISQDDKDARWGSTRQAFVGLTSSSFGTVKLGTQSSLSDSWHGGAGAENMGNLSTRNIIGGVKGSFAITKQPGITYVSPSFSGLTVGAGARYVGSTVSYYKNDTADAKQNDSFGVAGYALMDATVKYDLARFGLPGSSVGLNVNNLFDREYVSSCYSEYACYWGAGRQVIATGTFRF